MVIRQKDRPDLGKLSEMVLAGNRSYLSKAITLVESKLPSDEELAEQLISKLLPYSGDALRIAITGVPGVGKSTFIEAFGQLAISCGRKVAVLAIDPSSAGNKGSILGDKTRMNSLARQEHAFIRPSPSGATLGGVADKTRESLLLCEAAGFDIILIETVGVGQSETTVRGMTDLFVLLMLAGAGDELQGIKRGIIEMADIIAITKADGDNMRAATKSFADFRHTLDLFGPSSAGWKPQVVTCSASENKGIAEIWELVMKFETSLRASGHMMAHRAEQNLNWMQQKLDRMLKEDFAKWVAAETENMKTAILSNEVTPIAAARKLFELYQTKKGD